MKKAHRKTKAHANVDMSPYQVELCHRFSDIQEISEQRQKQSQRPCARWGHFHINAPLLLRDILQFQKADPQEIQRNITLTTNVIPRHPSDPTRLLFQLCKIQTSPIPKGRKFINRVVPTAARDLLSSTETAS